MSSKRSVESYATLPRTRSSGGGIKSMDEGSALINLTKQVSWKTLSTVVMSTMRRSGSIVYPECNSSVSGICMCLYV